MLDAWLEPDDDEEHNGEHDCEEKDFELFDFDQYIDQMLDNFESKIRRIYDLRYP
jgi:hypothetical protein